MKCDCCGQEVAVGGNTTKYYVGKEKELREKAEAANLANAKSFMRQQRALEAELDRVQTCLTEIQKIYDTPGLDCEECCTFVKREFEKLKHKEA